MPRYVLAIVSLGLLTACSREPDVTAPAAVTVVAGRTAEAAVKAVVLPKKVLAPTAEPSPTPKLLSVEETVRINTTEMWSEPLKVEEH